MQTTRQSILDVLLERHTVTVLELSRSLQVTRADVRHHLALLVKEGVVEVVGRSDMEGRGRPMLTYALARPYQPNNIDQLASALLQNLPDGGREAILRQTAISLAGKNKISGGGLAQRLVQAINHLNEMHYRARWEAHADGPRVIFAHCPYTTIVAECPDLCRMDAFLLQALTGQPVRQIARIDVEQQGIKHCIFWVGK
jgi:predicted ArsR family transcriptional regulator